MLVSTSVKQQVKRACMCMSILSRVISAMSRIRAAEYDVFYRDRPSTDFRFGSLADQRALQLLSPFLSTKQTSGDGAPVSGHGWHRGQLSVLGIRGSRPQ